jgi:DNA ligase D-like protein (predicted polymerase)/DNA ligase D-like protein (predicted 3'-phosphoesterase)
MPLKRYEQKRTFNRTPEPRGTVKQSTEVPVYCIQKHDASRLHYDFRLEHRGVLLSWAVPKGPSLNPADKRLSIHVEDHPYDYRDFEGVIPEGNYGAGTVMIWDEGIYGVEGATSRKEIERAIEAGLKKGHLDFFLEGDKLHGKFSLVQLKSGEKDQWLLIKGKDRYASTSDVTAHDKSVRTDRSLKEIAEGKRKKKKALASAKVKKVTLSNPDKVYWPKEKYTKGDMMDYYHAVSSSILPFLKNRPMVLRRFPDGIDGESFIQKNTTSLHLPDWIQTIEIPHEEKKLTYFLIQDLPTLEYVVNLGTIELHPFHSQVGTLDYPDYFVLDLDPIAVPFNTVIEAAQTIHQLFDEWKIPHYCKTSGGRGLHFYIPLKAKYTLNQVAKFGEVVGMLIHQEMAKITSLERSPSKREKKIYLDLLQNRSRQTIVAPYSLRGRPGAPVSTPLLWDELRKGMTPLDFTIKTVAARLEKIGEVFYPILGKGFNLKKWVEAIEENSA